MARGIKKILVPTDFSEGSHEALLQANELAKLLGAKLQLLHVIELGYLTVYGRDAFWPTEHTVKEIRGAAEMETTKFLQTVPEAKADFLYVESFGGSPADHICKEALEQKADLIVIGTHGRKGLDRMLLGSVTERVIRLAQCPVLVVPPKAND